MSVSAIAAISKHGVLGRGNQLLWHISEDFKWFKRQTKNKVVVMGRRTYESIGKPLVKRDNYVMTRNDDFVPPKGISVIRSLDEFVAKFRGMKEEVFVIGGEQIYRLTLPYVDKIYLTVIDTAVDGDAFFPEIDIEEWNQTFCKESSDNNYKYTFYVFDRR
jgi:dihydrofolate reductase